MKMLPRYYKVVDTSCSEQHGELTLTSPRLRRNKGGSIGDGCRVLRICLQPMGSPRAVPAVRRVECIYSKLPSMYRS